jgi:hypothetical protein
MAALADADPDTLRPVRPLDTERRDGGTSSSEGKALMSLRRTALVVTLVSAAVWAACAPSTPEVATRVSPSDGTGYVDPQISGDGDVVLSRREVDLHAAWDTPRDLVVSRIDTRTTEVVPGVREIQAVSLDARYVIHGSAATWRLDTTTGAEQPLRSGPGNSIGDLAISADGSTVAWTAVHFVAGNCPCEFRLHVWRDGAIVLDTLLQAAYTISIADQFRDDFLAMHASGSEVYLHRFATREIVRVDVATGVSSVLPLQLPPIPALWPFSDLRSYLFWSEWIDFGSSDGEQFRLRMGGTTYLVSRDAAPRVIPTSDTGDPSALSPDGRWLARITSSPVRPGVERLTYVVTDLLTGAKRQVVASDASTVAGTEPSRTFNGVPSVADDGRAVFGLWTPVFDQPWPPSVVYVDTPR